jgi:hypothetical protein
MGWSLCQGSDGGGGSSGTPYLLSQQGAKIELPVYGDDDLIIKFKFLRTVITPNTSYSCILGDVFDGNGVLLFYSGTHWEFFCGTGSHYTWTASYDDITEVEINTATGSIKINGTPLYSNVGTRTHNAICLFTNSQFSYHYVGAIGEVEVYKDNALYLDLVPMKDDQTGKGYYHDTVGNQDYYSTTSVPLIYAEL